MTDTAQLAGAAALLTAILAGLALWRANTWVRRRRLGLCTSCGHAPHPEPCPEYVTYQGHQCCCSP